MSTQGPEGRLRAWHSFRDIAHATCSLATSRATRWAVHEAAAKRHLAHALELEQRFAPEPTAAPEVIVAFGTDLGLCGRLNSIVSGATEGLHRERQPDLLICVGRRLAGVLATQLGALELPAPSTLEAVLDFAAGLQVQIKDACGPTLPRLVVVRLQPETKQAVLDLGPTSLEPSRWKGPALPPLGDASRVAADLALHARLVHASCAAALAEARMRQETMSHARHNAERRIVELERDLRRARQERITQEMLDVLNGRRAATESAADTPGVGEIPHAPVLS